MGALGIGSTAALLCEHGSTLLCLAWNEEGLNQMIYMVIIMVMICMHSVNIY